MLYRINRKQFVKNILATPQVWTNIIRDSENFKSEYYFDETNVFYLSTNYGSGNVITIFSPYSESILKEAKQTFKDAIGFCFACQFEDYDCDKIKPTHRVSYLYKLFELRKNTSVDISIKKIIDDTDINDLITYDNMYLSFLRENHGARLLNFWNREKENITKGKKALYLARNKENVLIGFIIINIFTELNACDITQISIEDAFQNQGYGKQFLSQVVDDIQRKHYDIYYSSVNDDNIVSQKVAERIGFSAVACEISIL